MKKLTSILLIPILITSSLLISCQPAKPNSEQLPHPADGTPISIYVTDIIDANGSLLTRELTPVSPIAPIPTTRNPVALVSFRYKEQSYCRVIPYNEIHQFILTKGITISHP